MKASGLRVYQSGYRNYLTDKNPWIGIKGFLEYPTGATKAATCAIYKHGFL